MDNDQLCELIRRSSLGQQDAFAELYDRTSPQVHGVVLRVLRVPEMAAEVTQEVYIEIWRTCTRYQPSRGSVIAWMVTIAHRRAVDRVRAATARKDRDDLYARREPQPNDHRGDEVWDTTQQHLDADLVRAGLETLTTAQREALLLAYFAGYTQTQIAQHLEIPLGTVKTRIRDGLTRLRHDLRSEHEQGVQP